MPNKKTIIRILVIQIIAAILVTLAALLIS